MFVGPFHWATLVTKIAALVPMISEVTTIIARVSLFVSAASLTVLPLTESGKLKVRVPCLAAKSDTKLVTWLSAIFGISPATKVVPLVSRPWASNVVFV